MSEVVIEFDTSAFDALVERLTADALASAVRAVLADVAERGATMVSGIPTDTGALAGSVRAKLLTNAAVIVADAERAGGVRYGRFVFDGWTDRGGNWHAGQRPNINLGELERMLAEGIAGVIDAA